jgi:hypothetical protein
VARVVVGGRGSPRRPLFGPGAILVVVELAKEMGHARNLNPGWRMA